MPCIFTEKSAVYDEGLHLSLLSDMSPITAPSTKMVPNNDTPAKYIEKLISQEKTLFSRVWQGDRREGVLDNFVERVRFYHNLEVHDD